MLKSLTIQNYAIIRDLQIEFSGGLTIITGETGAGKSILLGALSLLVGQRADTGVLFDSSRKCYVEGLFQTDGYGLEDLFRNNELDMDNETIVRREIGADGKSRAFINDTPVNLSVLKEFGERLIDIHSQHQNLYLDNIQFQLKILDTFARQVDLLAKYKEVFFSYRSLLAKYDKIQSEYQKFKADQEYIKFQFDQLAEARLVEGEQQTLEEELNTITHSEEIKEQLAISINALSDGEINILSQLKDAINAIGKLRNVYNPAANIYQRLDTVLIELKDISGELTNDFDHLEFDPERAVFVKQRIDLLYNLFQKHRVSAINDLITLRDELKAKMDQVENTDTLLEELKLQINQTKSSLENIANTLSRKRKEVIPVIEGKVQELLKNLGMPNGLFKVDISTLPELSNNGVDKVSFLFSANRQSAPQELSKVASGGEMARLMLSIKAVVAEEIVLPTIIFDEIDQGVSGDIADKMGNSILKIAKFAQVINITHLPQIASKGVNHFLVYKNDLGNTTQTQIKQLQSDDRVIEIARMLSGEKLSEAAINNAKALLGIN
jgi:DNA repair protein RecN (Recombination protein N)